MKRSVKKYDAQLKAKLALELVSAYIPAKFLSTK
jgi:hypothetical protein